MKKLFFMMLQFESSIDILLELAAIDAIAIDKV